MLPNLSDSSSSIQPSPLHCAALLYGQQRALCWIDKGDSERTCSEKYRQLDYQQLSIMVLNLGEKLLSKGFSRGDKLACITHNSIELIILYWACVDLGLIFCPLSPKLPPAQYQQLLSTLKIKGVYATIPFIGTDKKTSNCKQFNFSYDEISSTAHSSKLQPPSVDPNTAVNLILTSGSSGRPKAAAHSLTNHIASAQGAATVIPLSNDDCWLLSLPVFHIGGLAILNRCALAGACIAIEQLEIPLPQQIIQSKVSHLSLVPTQAQRLLTHSSLKQSLQTIKALLLGGGPIPTELLKQLDTLKISHYTSYGMTEMSSQITTGSSDGTNSCGAILPYRQLKIIDGEIWVKGETLFLGYLNEQDQLECPLDDQGWFNTHDRGFYNNQQQLHISGRSDNMFICGGENIQPEELERLLITHPAIDNAIVFPIEDSEFGLLPVAIIQTASLDDIEAELESYLFNQLARFKRPRCYYRWPEIKSSGLKVSRKQVIAAVKERYQLS